MNKKIITTIGVLAVAAVLFLAAGNISFAPTAAPTQESESRPESVGKENNQIKPQFPGQTLPLSTSPKDVAWAVFQKYLGYNKDQNLEGVRSVVYKVAAVCEDPKTTIDCKARIGLAYQYGSALKKEDFVNVWSDQKQIILATNFKIEEDDTSIGRARAIIFFVRSEADDLKMLSFSPFKGAVTSKGAASEEELNDRLIRYTEDNDKDGIADYEEECLNKPGDLSCIKTNPKIRDTDSDGLWDGVEALMK